MHCADSQEKVEEVKVSRGDKIAIIIAVLWSLIFTLVIMYGDGGGCR